MCERRTADDRWDRAVFRKIKRDSGLSEKFTIKFRQKKEPGHRNIPQDSGAGPFSRVIIYNPKLDLTGSS